MEAAARALPISVADYLAFEETAGLRHEFIGGEIHAMGGASEPHNTIAGNIFSALRLKLRGGPRRVYMADFKVWLEVQRTEIFYYPDVVVTCHPTGIERQFLRLPTLVVEVLSPSTENIDRREKRLNYRESATLEEYVIVAQVRREVTVFRRANGWQGESCTEPSAVVAFRSIQQSMTVGEIYEDVR